MSDYLSSLSEIDDLLQRSRGLVGQYNSDALEEAPDSIYDPVNWQAFRVDTNLFINDVRAADIDGDSTTSMEEIEAYGMYLSEEASQARIYAARLRSTDPELAETITTYMQECNESVVRLNLAYMGFNSFSLGGESIDDNDINRILAADNKDHRSGTLTNRDVHLLFEETHPREEEEEPSYDPNDWDPFALNTASLIQSIQNAEPIEYDDEGNELETGVTQGIIPGVSSVAVTLPDIEVSKQEIYNYGCALSGEINALYIESAMLQLDDDMSDDDEERVAEIAERLTEIIPESQNIDIIYRNFDLFSGDDESITSADIGMLWSADNSDGKLGVLTNSDMSEMYMRDQVYKQEWADGEDERIQAMIDDLQDVRQTAVDRLAAIDVELGQNKTNINAKKSQLSSIEKSMGDIYNNGTMSYESFVIWNNKKEVCKAEVAANKEIKASLITEIRQTNEYVQGIDLLIDSYNVYS